MVLPNLFIPGAGKSGTSSLHEYLNQHPDIFMSPFKEPQFFSHDINRTPGMVGYNKGIEAYEKYFIGAEGFKYVGESSTTYMCFPYVIERIKKHIKDPKFIFILRNPIDRAYSHYCWLNSLASETLSFRDAFLLDMHQQINSENTCDDSGRYKYYYQLGLYSKWLQYFFDAFGRECIFLISFEQLVTTPLQTLNCCFRFLQLEELHNIELVRSNSSGKKRHPVLYHLAKLAWNKTFLQKLNKIRVLEGRINALRELVGKTKPPPPLPQEDRAWVSTYYFDDVSRLREITGHPFHEWGNDFPT